MEIRRVGFITNVQKDPKFDYTSSLVKYLLKKGVLPVLNKALSKVSNEAELAKNYNELYEKSDFVIVLGGDGTILRVARKAAFYQTPILGINLGTLGYLADVEKKDAFEAIDKVLSGNYTIEKRMMLEANFKNKKCSQNINLALNEVYIYNSSFSRMINIDLEINDDFINTCKGDGIIISTPTGSTAYNLSAGGPILKPDTELIAITHVCPHTLYTRPYVVSGNDMVKVGINENHNNVKISFDGQYNMSVEKGDKIIIRRSEYYTGIIKTTDLSFYDILRRKMVEVRK